MHSLILAATSKVLLPLLLLFSLFLLFRGHYHPGGGFVGGLVATAAFTLYTISSGVHLARKSLRINPRSILAIGLLMALTSALVSAFKNQPLFTSSWCKIDLPIASGLGTPAVFDVGVYLVVVGVGLTIVFTLAER